MTRISLPADRDRMLSFLRLYGSLDKAGKYAGGDRAGYQRDRPAQAMTTQECCSQPIDMHTLLDEKLLAGHPVRSAV